MTNRITSTASFTAKVESGNQTVGKSIENKLG
jgi:hypothetical protein